MQRRVNPVGFLLMKFWYRDKQLLRWGRLHSHLYKRLGMAFKLPGVSLLIHITVT